MVCWLVGQIEWLHGWSVGRRVGLLACRLLEEWEVGWGGSGSCLLGNVAGLLFIQSLKHPL